ncbi:HSP20-like chaperone [Echria macrotheca]|uniref:HSP20-like chaperone n=1 Tax=Echria macrotheca TaxID=438768 RepID=A0AAJ0BEB8_9PEZI|nr:HSP20-like chaperone [Echria macrotheca]
MSLWTPRHPPGFSSLFRMLDDFDRYAQQAGAGAGGAVIPGIVGGDTSSSVAMTIAPKFDIAEHENSYKLQGELPGVPPENVNIEFTDPQTLVISGRVERERVEGDPAAGLIEGGGEGKGKIEGKKEEGKEKEKGKEGEKKEGERKEGEGEGKPEPKYWLTERSYGEFSRVFNFPVPVDQDKVQAKFKDGVLDIVVPKMEKKGGRKKIEIK